MSEKLTQAITKNQYDKHVEKYGRTPTQDPIYNHSAGNPLNRASPDGASFAHGSPASLMHEDADPMPSDQELHLDPEQPTPDSK
jgi:hypothetical protein